MSQSIVLGNLNNPQQNYMQIQDEETGILDFF